MRDDYAIAADLCEEHGLVEPTRVLRQIAGRASEVFMVRPDERYVRYREMSGPLVEATLRTRCLFRTREAAERHAAYLDVAFFRESWQIRYDRQSLFTVTEAEFCRRVGDVLKMGYHLPAAPSAPLIPAWTSDEQLDAIAPLLSLKLFEVVGVPLDPGGEA